MARIETLTLKIIIEAALKRSDTRAKALSLLKEIPTYSNYFVEYVIWIVWILPMCDKDLQLI